VQEQREEEEELGAIYRKAHAVPLASARQRLENQKENQACKPGRPFFRSARWEDKEGRHTKFFTSKVRKYA
jgi:hypothetical protein